MKIYTKTGDTGETGLFKGPRVPKHDLRVEAYGNVDECNAVIGVALCHVQHPHLRTVLQEVQNDLFEVGADLATPPQQQQDERWRIDAQMTQKLEQHIDAFEATLPELTNFILPGGSMAGAYLHYARTVCRRAERSVTRLAAEQNMNPEIIRYLNRLSDLLFVLARAENQHCKSPEITWIKRNN
jgi:cob(I)alamin adenosyltransferase